MSRSSTIKGRPPLFDHPMTGAERQRRYRERLASPSPERAWEQAKEALWTLRFALTRHASENVFEGIKELQQRLNELQRKWEDGEH